MHDWYIIKIDKEVCFISLVIYLVILSWYQVLYKRQSEVIMQHTWILHLIRGSLGTYPTLTHKSAHLR